MPFALLTEESNSTAVSADDRDGASGFLSNGLLGK